MGPIWRGPLKVDKHHETRGANQDAQTLLEIDPFNYTDRAEGDEDEAERLARCDARFIVALRNALPALLALVDGSPQPEAPTNHEQTSEPR
jgi:hypothetical protein